MESTAALDVLPYDPNVAGAPWHLQLAQAVARGHKLKNENNEGEEDSNTCIQDLGADEGKKSIYKGKDTSLSFFLVGIVIGFLWGGICFCSTEKGRQRYV